MKHLLSPLYPHLGTQTFQKLLKSAGKQKAWDSRWLETGRKVERKRKAGAMKTCDPVSRFLYLPGWLGGGGWGSSDQGRGRSESEAPAGT